MSYDLNRVTLIGRLGSDPELKYIPSGNAVCNFSLAVGARPKPDGSNTVSFFKVTVWNKIAENCSNYLKKGFQVAVEGRLEQRSWKAQDGSNRSVIEVIAERVQFLQHPKVQQEPAEPTNFDPSSLPESNEDDINF